jgi:hypothetical protein
MLLLLLLDPGLNTGQGEAGTYLADGCWRLMFHHYVVAWESAGRQALDDDVVRLLDSE